MNKNIFWITILVSLSFLSIGFACTLFYYGHKYLHKCEKENQYEEISVETEELNKEHILDADGFSQTENGNLYKIVVLIKYREITDISEFRCDIDRISSLAKSSSKIDDVRVIDFKTKILKDDSDERQF